MPALAQSAPSIAGPDFDVLLRDGSTARVRLIRPGDAEAIVALHARASPESLRLRFFAPHPSLSASEVARLIAHTTPDQVALVAERDERLIAIAQYDRETGQDDAEVAFLVEDSYQHMGVATILLEHLAAVARTEGIRRFVAVTLWENMPMRGVFRDVGFAPKTSQEFGEVRVVLDIAPTPAAMSAADERDRQAIVSSIARLLQPRSIAVIGAGRQSGGIGHEIVRNLVESGFEGPLYPVNPNARAVASIPCHPSIEAITDSVDLAIVAVPAPNVLEVVGACGRKGVSGLVVVTAGFAETGAVGAQYQREIVRLAHSHGMRLIGPNCFGIINTDPAISMNATFSADLPIHGTIGFASQSGGLGIAILAEAAQRDLGLSSFVSMGNKGDVSGNDLLTWWEQDDATNVILLYLESFGNPKKFHRIAQRVSRSKPIVAVKAGRSHAGTRAASSHTAAMASPEQAVDALCRQTGVVRVETIEELFDVAEVLAHQPLPSGHRVAIVSNAGGPGVLAADACASRGLEVPEFSAPLQGAILKTVRDGAGVANPIDLIASASADQYRDVLRLVLGSGEVDAVLVIFTPPLITQGHDVAAALRGVVDRADGPSAQIPIVAAFLGPRADAESLRESRRRVPCFTYPETAVRALAGAIAYGTWRSSVPGEIPVLAGTDPNEARRRIAEGFDVIDASREDRLGWLSGERAMSVLDSYGIPTVRTVHVDAPAQAARVAEQIGYPVVLKADGREIVHKSDLGGVCLDLRSAEEVAAAFGSMQASIGTAMTGAVIQPMVRGGVETIIGLSRDESFGAQILFGLGGTSAELLADHVVRLAPLTDRDAAEMVTGIRGAPLFSGFRGSAPLDTASLRDLILRLGRLAEDLPELTETDCNPVVVTAQGPLVLDARLHVAAETDHEDPRHLSS